jgi:hypothetical protein
MPARRYLLENCIVTQLSASLLILTIAFAAFFPCIVSGEITYTIKQTNNTTIEQKAAHERIKIAMDSALYFYNKYTTITKKLTVEYAPSVPTAQANFDGLMSFGKSADYQVVCTAMHETAHAIGIGTTNEWSNLMNNGIVNSTRATAKLREITGKQNDVLKGDKPPNLWHFWPYGLNYASEVSSVSDLINHCLIVNELYYEMFPAKEPPKVSVTLMQPSTDNLRTVVFQDFGLTMQVSANHAITAMIFSLDGKTARQFTINNSVQNAYLRLPGGNNMTQGAYIYRVISGPIKIKGSFIITH